VVDGEHDGLRRTVAANRFSRCGVRFVEAEFVNWLSAPDVERQPSESNRVTGKGAND